MTPTAITQKLVSPIGSNHLLERQLRSTADALPIGSKTMGIGGHHRGWRGLSDVWLTPPEILNALGKFDLDPCAPAIRPWDTAHIHYSDGGLDRPWFGRIWLNPPYGQQTGHWLRKLADHGNGIAIIFARTETRMFFQQVWRRAHGLLFLKGRLHFHRADGTRAKANAGAPSVLVALWLIERGNVADVRLGGALRAVRK